MLKRSADRSETEGIEGGAALTALAAALGTLGCGRSFSGGIFAGVKGEGEGDLLTVAVHGEFHGVAGGVLVLGGGEFGKMRTVFGGGVKRDGDSLSVDFAPEGYAFLAFE